MYDNRLKFKSSRMLRVDTVDGERIEDKVRRVQHNGEAITDGAPEIFTEKSKGVQAAYNIRTDRWEIAAEAMDKVHKIDPNSEGKWGDGKVVDMAGKEVDTGDGSTDGSVKKA